MKAYPILAAGISMLGVFPAAAADFSGLRAEVTASRAEDSVRADLDNGTSPFSRKQDDVSFGVEAGYDLDLGSAVVGAYVGADFPNVESCDAVFGADEFCYTAKRNYALGARAGFKVAGPILAYAKAGYSSGRFKSVYQDVANPSRDVEGTGNERGIHYGVGAEAAFGAVYGKAEYLRTDYAEGDLGHDVARNQLKLGVGLRF